MVWRDTAILARTDWAEGLWTLRLDVPVDFAPGQFINLGLDVEGELVKRSYSIASAPRAPVELYVAKVDTGVLTPRLYAAGVGDRVRVDDTPYGFFVLGHVPDCEVLWLIATGTGLGPFMSMLRSGQLWARFPRVVLVHGVRLKDHLGYHDELEELALRRPLRYVPMLTREHDEEMLHGRVPAALQNGHLEKAVGVALDEKAHVMLCGNPFMIADCTRVLNDRGLRKHRRREPGHITIEKYW